MVTIRISARSAMQKESFMKSRVGLLLTILIAIGVLGNLALMIALNEAEHEFVKEVNEIQ
ncbi:hypothetical protein SEA_SPILLED_235 [Streptomyces phage Spilled]|uniref:Uncharacterized protein n=3 Tax=Streptomyces virus Karimac TaxID=2846401 RepID=A0A345M868_9CAUD|nr:hypothetical protein SEA_STARBOW_225 [Streptomyces phage Starbow]QDF17350.1 hypothetical protein SEA_BIRCHLYN_227 [Streptomyces phage Birchlyn]QFP97500.1 hypothetical protein SEA_ICHABODCRANE_222 [Streptomyces phage IchabodCrane]QPL13820.1 membrane protein [Streptomyces phage MindFlayer]URM86759.1 membrane protein [Streptomyces phage SaltySpitoon]URM87713.1 hypothetical protein SEA_QUARAN19_228 [Streptomyces phage Quaran19]UVK60145.1 hypothetical protein SEA_SPILLED_235 [Streptomyces phage